MPYTKDDVSEYRNVSGVNVRISDAERQAIADEWNESERAREQARADALLQAKRDAALRAVSEQALTERLADPDAPQEVVKYAEALREAQRLTPTKV